MNLRKIFNTKNFKFILESIVSLSIVASIFFLAFELRQNTISIQLSNRQSAMEMGNEWDSWIKDTSFADTYILALNDFSSLSPTQKLQVDKYISQGLNIWEFVFGNLKDGVIEESQFIAWDRFFTEEYKNNRLWQLIWDQKKNAYEERFQDHINLIMEKKVELK